MPEIPPNQRSNGALIVPGADPDSRPEPRSTPVATGTTPRPGLRGGVTRGRKARRENPLQSWELWWGLNRDRFLAGPERAHEFTPAGYRLGRGEPGSDGCSASPLVPAEGLDPEILRACEESLRDSTCDRRIAAVLSLGKLRSPAALARMIQGLRDECPNVRASSCLALGIHGGPLVLPMLGDLLADSRNGRRLMARSRLTAQSRSYAAAALGLTGSREALAPLLAALDLPASDREVSLSAILALGALGDPEAVPHLARIVQDRSRDRNLRVHALAALGRLGDRGVLPLAEAFLEDRDADLRRSAILACGILARPEDETAVKALRIAAEKGRDELGACWALLSLGEIGGTAARKSLRRTLQDGQDSKRAFAALGLGILHFGGEVIADDRRAVRERFLLARSESLKGALAVALGLMNDLESVRALTGIVAGSDGPDLKGHAAVALALLDARRAEPVIRAMLREKGKPQLAWDVSLALGRIGGPRTVGSLLSAIGSPGSDLELSGTALSLGRMGDQDAVQPLCHVARGKSASTLEQTSAVQALGFLADRSAGGDANSSLSRLKSQCNYALPFPAMRGFARVF